MLHLTTVELLVQRRWVADVDVQLEFETPNELLAVYVRTIAHAPIDGGPLRTEEKWIEITEAGTGLEPLIYAAAEKQFKVDARAIREYFPAKDPNAEHRMQQREFI